MTVPGSVAAPGASGHLGEKLKRALGGPEVGHAEADVRRDDAHERDVRDVVSLGDHLRSDEDIVVALAESAQDGS